MPDCTEDDAEYVSEPAQELSSLFLELWLVSQLSDVLY